MHDFSSYLTPQLQALKKLWQGEAFIVFPYDNLLFWARLKPFSAQPNCENRMRQPMWDNASRPCPVEANHGTDALGWVVQGVTVQLKGEEIWCVRGRLIQNSSDKTPWALITSHGICHTLFSSFAFLSHPSLCVTSTRFLLCPTPSLVVSSHLLRCSSKFSLSSEPLLFSVPVLFCSYLSSSLHFSYPPQPSPFLCYPLIFSSPPLHHITVSSWTTLTRKTLIAG